MRVPSDAQARALALVEDYAEGGLYWSLPREREGASSRAALFFPTEHGVRQLLDYAVRVPRVMTVHACVNHGWIDADHEREFLRVAGVYAIDHEPEPFTMRELVLQEDGVIALGVWRERKLNAPPAPLPTLTGRELEVAELAMRAYELGYALSPREPARREARQMRRAGWFTTCWLANAAYGLVPSPMTLVEIRPEQADAPLAESFEVQA